MRFRTIVQTHPSLPSGMTTTISRDPPSSCAICCSEDAVACTVHARGFEPPTSSSIAWVFWFLESKSSSSAVVPVLQFLKTTNCHFFSLSLRLLKSLFFLAVPEDKDRIITFLPCSSWRQRNITLRLRQRTITYLFCYSSWRKRES